MLAVQPSPISAAIDQLPTDLTPLEWSALAIAVAPGGRHARTAACDELHRVLGPLALAGAELRLDAHAIGWVQRAVLRGMHSRHTACGSWNADDWIAVAKTARSFRGNVVAVAWLLGRLTIEHVPAAGVCTTHLARRLFGRSQLEHEVDRIRAHLRTIGYGRSAMSRRSLMTALATLFLRAGRAQLEAVTVELIQNARRAAPARAEQRRMYYRVAHALHGMGLVPNAIHHRTYTSVATTNIDAEWVAWCTRWRGTTTLAPASARSVYYAVLKAGRWLAHEHPEVRSPDGWTRDLALAYVSAVNDCKLGEFVTPDAYKGRPSGTSLSPCSKVRLLSAVRTFLRDCQEWGWCARHFDPQRVMATPRSLNALTGPSPRVLADDIWAKLLWAGLQIQETDLPNSDSGVERIRRAGLTYPIELVKAVAIAWLFTGLRSDELVRLRVGCIRWQQRNGSPGAASEHVHGDDATCLVDVPIHKTGASFTKPVDPLVGEFIARWEERRPMQPLLVDRKTGARFAALFCFRGRAIPTQYINDSLIPLLCRKAGVPMADARGRITSHRARATIASQLYNAKEPMTLFELQTWLGHRSPATTQHYARITPTTLAKAYADAGYFARNLRSIEVLVDRDAVVHGGAAIGQSWQYYDLGHGYCTYSFFEQCPHRMACARCDFYLPKRSSKAQLLEAKANLQRMMTQIPLTDDERAAVEDGTAAVERLIERLANIPRPAGPTPTQLAESANFIPLGGLLDLEPTPAAMSQP
jgi:integrase